MAPTAGPSVAYVDQDIPPAGTAVEVAPGVHWVRMPLPFALDHVNLWVLEDGDGLTLVDTGFANDEVRGLWEDLLAGPFGGRRVARLVCTHFHPDHMGLAGWMTRRFGVDLWATLGEYAFGRMLSLDDSPDSPVIDAMRDFYRAAGFEAALMEKVEARGNPYPRRVTPFPAAYRRLCDGSQLTVGGRTWRVIVGTGHSPEHACLFCEDIEVLISGDQVLPRITPNVSVWPQEPDADPLALFAASLERFRLLPAETLVLSSHDRPFRGLHARLDQLGAHHEERLEATLDACREPRPAVAILRELFHRPLDDHQLFFAIGETLAHLHHLMALGRVVRDIDGEGVHLYRAAG